MTNQAIYTYSQTAAPANVIGMVQAGAFNPRCSTAILSRHVLGRGTNIYLQSGTGRFAVIVSVGGGNTIIATLHAEAGNAAGTDRSGLLGELFRSYPGAASIIVGGDWNIAPPGATLALGTERTRVIWNVATDGQVTHPNTGNVLDYFIYRGGVALTNVARDPNQHGSDHYPVTASFT